MDSTTSLLLAIIGSGAFASVVTWWLTKPKQKAETRKLSGEADAQEAENALAKRKLADEIQRLVNEKVEATQKNATNEMQIRILEGQLARNESTIQRVLVSHGEMKAREDQCNERLTALEESRKDTDRKLNNYDRVYDHKMQMVAILKDLRARGVWTGDAEQFEGA